MKYPPNYFQGILQLRDCKEEVIDFVNNQIKKANREDVYVSKSVRIKNGIDLYLTSNKFLRSLGKKLKKHFNGQLKESEKLFSRDRQTGKEVYRLNVLFRLIDIKRGEIINHKGKRLKIMSIGNKIQTKDLDTGKRTYINFKEII